MTGRRETEGRRNVLVVSPTPSHPTTAGNRARVDQLRRILKTADLEVHLIYYALEGASPDQEAFLGLHWDSVRVVTPAPDRSLRKGRLELSRELKRAVSEAIDRLEPLAVICNYIWMADALSETPAGTLRVLDTHDRFAYRKEMFAGSGVAYGWHSTTIRDEAAAAELADLILCITPLDRRYFSAVCDSPAAVLSYEPPAAGLVAGSRGAVGFIGSDNAINALAANDLTATFERAAPSDKSLVIAGAIARKARPGRNVVLLPQVNQLADYYGRIDLAALPIFHGTGQKIKAVEALAHGRAVLATREAFSGIEPAHAYHDLLTHAEFDAALADVLENDDALAELAECSRQAWSRYRAAVSAQTERFVSAILSGKVDADADPQVDDESIGERLEVILGAAPEQETDEDWRALTDRAIGEWPLQPALLRLAGARRTLRDPLTAASLLKDAEFLERRGVADPRGLAYPASMAVAIAPGSRATLLDKMMVPVAKKLSAGQLALADPAPRREAQGPQPNHDLRVFSAGADEAVMIVREPEAEPSVTVRIRATKPIRAGQFVDAYCSEPYSVAVAEPRDGGVVVTLEREPGSAASEMWLAVRLSVGRGELEGLSAEISRVSDDGRLQCALPSVWEWKASHPTAAVGLHAAENGDRGAFRWMGARAEIHFARVWADRAHMVVIEGPWSREATPFEVLPVMGADGPESLQVSIDVTGRWIAKGVLPAGFFDQASPRLEIVGPFPAAPPSPYDPRPLTIAVSQISLFEITAPSAAEAHFLGAAFSLNAGLAQVSDGRLSLRFSGDRPLLLPVDGPEPLRGVSLVASDTRSASGTSLQVAAALGGRRWHANGDPERGGQKVRLEWPPRDELDPACVQVRPLGAEAWTLQAISLVTEPSGPAPAPARKRASKTAEKVS